LREFVISETGRIRTSNQDQVFADAEAGLWVVADGMGGHVGGARASALACEAVIEAVSHGMALADAFEVAHSRVRTEQQAEPALSGMGTTLVAVHEKADRYEIAWVGDSRIYRFRGSSGKLTCLTRDQTVPGMLLQRGQISAEQAKQHPQRHVLTDCIGQLHGLPSIETRALTWQSGDRLLLCSDGLSGEVEDEEIARWFATIENPRELAEKLVACALDHGGRDNVSLIVLDAPTDSGQPSRRLWRQLR